jgi:hypothetical protein
VAENTGISAEQLTAILKNINEGADERMVKFAQELRKLTPEEQAKVDLERAKTRERVLASAKVAQALEEGAISAAKNCPHGTTHEGTGVFKQQFRAQVMSPAGEKPYYMPRCTQCQSTWDKVYGLPSPKVIAHPSQISNGVNMDKWSMDDIHRVVEWLRRNPVVDQVA